MARCKPIDASPRFLAVELQRQLLPGTFEHALNHLIDRELDLSGFDARFNNDATGAAAHPPAMSVGVAVFASSQDMLPAATSKPSAAAPPAPSSRSSTCATGSG